MSIAAAANTVLAVPWYEDEWFNEHLPPFGSWIREVVDWMSINLSFLWTAIEWPIDKLLNDVFIDTLDLLPWPVVVVLGIAIGWFARGPVIGLGTGAGLVFIGFLGPDFWFLGLQTFAMIITAVVFCVILGMPLGILAARRDGFESTIRPVLDAMQTIHPFVYLLPAVFFWGIGRVPGVIVTVVFAMPPMVRLTNLGIRQVPSDVVEAARAFGTRDFQLLREIQLPLARPTILAGLNQTLMLALSMVVIVALIAGGGLGQQIFRGVGQADIPLASTSGIAVLIVAVILDRVSQPRRAAGAVHGE